MIQYSHKRDDIECTIFVDTPTKQQLEQLLISYQAEIELTFGMSVKSKNDCFNKKIGREVAINNSFKAVFTLDNCYFSKDKNIYTLYEFIKHNNTLYYVTLYLTSVPKSERVYLIDSEIETFDDLEIEE